MQTQIQATGFSETLVDFYQPTRHHMPEDIVFVTAAKISNLKYSSLIHKGETNTSILLCFALSVETRNFSLSAFRYDLSPGQILLVLL